MRKLIDFFFNIRCIVNGCLLQLIHKFRETIINYLNMEIVYIFVNNCLILSASQRNILWYEVILCALCNEVVMTSSLYISAHSLCRHCRLQYGLHLVRMLSDIKEGYVVVTNLVSKFKIDFCTIDFFICSVCCTLITTKNMSSTYLA